MRTVLKDIQHSTFCSYKTKYEYSKSCTLYGDVDGEPLNLHPAYQKDLLIMVVVLVE